MRKHVANTILILLLFAGGWWLGGHSKVNSELSSQRQTNHEICVAVNNLNHAITQSLNRSKVNVPKIAYFRKHPGELKAQLAAIDRTINDFKPRTC